MLLIILADMKVSLVCYIHNLGWSSLEYRRKELRALPLYKIFYNLIEVNTAGILIPTTRVTRGNSLKFNQPYTRVDCYLYSFYPDAIKIWNHLPDHLTMLTDIDTFRKDIINYIT